MNKNVVASAVLALVWMPSAGAIEWELVEWRAGLAYASGIGDVTDLYEENLRIEGFDAEVDLKFPLGLTGAVRYDWPSGIRGDIGLGPMFFIGGDIDHFELPLSVTVGYNFLPDANVSPYVRGGLIHHIASGDYYSSSDPGLFAAAGLDFTHFSLEVALDRSEVEFDTFACNAAGAACRPAVTSLNTYDIIASFFWRF
jgi:hypothetical protein